MKKSLGAKTLLYPAPVMVIATYDSEERPNAMTAAWGGICCSQPPCVAVSLRKATHTYGNLMRQRAFTVNITPEDRIKAADYFGMASGKSGDKIKAAGLTPVKSELVPAPYLEEFPLVLECKLVHTLELGLHTQFVGEILDVKADEDKVNAENLPVLEAIKPVLFAPGTRAYYRTGGFLFKAFTTKKP